MKKNKLILLLILLLLIGLYFLLRTKQPQEKLLPVFDLDTLAINRIEIYDAQDTLKMVKQGNCWRLIYPVNWEADSLKIHSLFKDILTAKYSKTPMGTGKEAILKFHQRDEETLHLIVSDGKKTVHTLFSNLNNPYDYFRYAGSEEIYQVKTKVTNVYNTDLANWRSPHIVSHQENDLVKIEVTHPKNKYTLTRKGLDWYYQDAHQNFQIHPYNRAMIKILNILEHLDTYIFVDNAQAEYAAKFDDPYCTVKLFLTNNRTQDLKFIEHYQGHYLMMVDNDPTVLFVVVWDTVFRFTRPPDVFRMQELG
ncbi:MAG TPA: DUF4340 domain-containing protein [Candidatus Cloacimonas sp.]|jgi:hypothetical protein|nr:DUF4340 domain-containing protein [Candidatus Cloacimonas sp.]MDD2250536.1 DUF4340 domain-containing protein [Candidatus Cloacimonadota bacterium]MCK9158129.1 DUF4340 domain-containing protein [Candidatus Cloacimonas sp.]MCK9164753.1 DUF4340 domain-containing protein [Candidatus Cloacimonas sp.]MDD3734466.1 DUF4340 domain-containing protein [Candidatus Cloacimonadota bacterium]